MNAYREYKNLGVNQREETMITQHPGFVATEKVVRDVTAERQIGLHQVNRILIRLLVFLVIVMAMRFGLKAIGANPASGFAILVYGLSGLFVSPFIGLVANPTFGGASIEYTTLIAIGVYALIFWGEMYLIRLLVDRPKVRLFSLVTREQSPGDKNSVRTTRTTISNGKI